MRYGKCLVLLATLLVTDLMATALWLALTCTLPEPEVQAADAIAVLWGDNAGLGAETRRRLDLAEQLWRDRNGGIIALIGGDRPSRGFSGAQAMAAALVAAGVPPSCLVLDGGSNDTRSNLREVEELGREHGFSRVLIVTDRLQAFRISLLYPDANHILAPYPLSAVGFKPRFFWKRVHREWLSFAVFFLLPDQLRLALLAHFRG